MARTWRYCPVIRLKRNLVDGLGVERQSPLMSGAQKGKWARPPCMPHNLNHRSSRALLPEAGNMFQII
jgi:hypothetical protein